MRFRFVWDDVKAASNLGKHGISFDDAAEIFADPFFVSIQDRIESGERRWQTIGSLRGATMLFVAHLSGESGDGTLVIRIISARRATRRERRLYEEERYRSLRR